MTSRIPPGANYSDLLVKRLDDALQKKPRTYRPRTKHFQSTGPAFVNRLIEERSPYLLQHAHNPVDWHPFGDEAFALAAALDRPVFLSVGYSTCHWCHVMEEESFEDLDIATFLNEHFVCIKVDREERPDVDALYMSAVVAMTQAGGWPMSVWLTPTREAFFAGTYFPARDGDRGDRVGFLTLNQRVLDAFQNNREQVRTHAAQVTEALKKQLMPPQSTLSLDVESILLAAHKRATAEFDPEHGGMNAHMKFPSQTPTRFWLRYREHQNDEHGMQMVSKTLEAMQKGGIFDQLAGGFHRYSTEPTWLIPHFEKMLYDNAQLASVYVEAWQQTRRQDFKETACAVLDYLLREMTSKEGVFYSATDADSLTPNGKREEGYVFTWTPAEVSAELGPLESELFRRAYGVSEEGHFEGRSVLHRALAVDDDDDDIKEELERLKVKLLEIRNERPQPLLDDKIVVAWNGLAISALAKAGFAFARDDYRDAAAKAAREILSTLKKGTRLFRTREKTLGFLNDYAFLCAGLLDTFTATGEFFFLEEAQKLDAELAESFEREEGGFYFSPSHDDSLFVREMPNTDGAEPCGNSVHGLNLLRLHTLTGDETYKDRAERVFTTFSQQLKRAPLTLSEMLLPLMRREKPSREIVATGIGIWSSPLLEVLRSRLSIGCELVVSESLEGITLALAEGRRGLKTPQVFICEGGVCQAPIFDAADLHSALDS